MSEIPKYFEKVFRESFIGKLKAKLSGLGIVDFLKFQNTLDERSQVTRIDDIIFTEKGLYTIHECNAFHNDDALELGISPKVVACRYISSLDQILKNHEWKTGRCRFGNGIYQMVFSKKYEDENSGEAFMYAGKPGKYEGDCLFIKFEITDLSKYIVLPNSSQFKHHGEIGCKYEPVYDNILPLVQKIHPDIRVPENYQAKIHDYEKEYDEYEHFVGNRDILLNSLIDNQYKLLGIENIENLPHDMSDIDFDGNINKLYPGDTQEDIDARKKIVSIRNNIEKTVDGLIYYEPRYNGYVVQTFNQNTIRVVGGYVDYANYISLEEAKKED